MREFFQVSIPIPVLGADIPCHNFKELIVEIIADQNDGYKPMAEALLKSIEIVGISIEGIFDFDKHFNVTLELSGPESIMHAWAAMHDMIF